MGKPISPVWSINPAESDGVPLDQQSIHLRTTLLLGMKPSDQGFWTLLFWKFDQNKKSNVQNPCWLMIIGGYTIQFCVDYHNPLWEILLINQYKGMTFRVSKRFGAESSPLHRSNSSRTWTRWCLPYTVALQACFVAALLDHRPRFILCLPIAQFSFWGTAELGTGERWHGFVQRRHWKVMWPKDTNMRLVHKSDINEEWGGSWCMSKRSKTDVFAVTHTEVP